MLSLCSVFIAFPKVTQAASPDGFRFTNGGNYSLVSGTPTGHGALDTNPGIRNVKNFPEGSCVPMVIDISNSGNSTSTVTVNPSYEYFGGGVVGISNLETVTVSSTVIDPRDAISNLNQFTYTGSPLSSTGVIKTRRTQNPFTVGSGTPTITGPFAGSTAGTTSTSATDSTRHYNISMQLPPRTIAYLPLCARLGLDAGQHPGSNLTVDTHQTGVASEIRIDIGDILRLPSLTLVKRVPGGPDAASRWSFNVSPAINGISTFPIPEGSNTTTINNIPLDARYEITEVGPSGYSLTSTTGTNCTFSEGVASSTIRGGTPAQNGICVFTNTAVPARITVTKTVSNTHGGTLGVSDFPLFVNASSVISGEQVTVGFGTLTVSETSVAGYSAVFGGDCDENGQVTVGPGSVVNCTITNSDEAARLTVLKIVDNNNGGTLTSSDFTLNVSGVNPSTSTFRGSVEGTLVLLDAGAFAVTEDEEDGYTAEFSGDCSGTAAVGEELTCVITNSDEPAHLTVIKTVINNNGGTRVASDFTLNVTGDNATPASFSGSAGTAVTLSAGSYSVDETEIAGYTKTLGTGCSGTIALGESRTCTITNDDQPATLTVIKQVINDEEESAGEANASDFTMLVTGTNASQTSFSGSESGTVVTLDAGAYSVDEASMSGYEKTIGEDCAGIIANGASVTCTIVNDDLPPPPPEVGTLLVITNVTNTHGGTLGPSNFVMNVSGVDPSTSGFLGSEAPGVAVTLGVGSYGVTVDTVTGYSATLSEGCSGNIENGQTLTCTVTESDIAPQLTVVKTVVNDHGATSSSSDFMITVDAVNVSPTSTFPGSSEGTIVTLDAGAYDVSETETAMYTSSFSDGCTGTIGLGETRTCTITNNDVPAQLIISKIVINDNAGSSTARDFMVQVTGTNVSSSTFPGASSTVITLAAGSYSVDELDSMGYIKTLGEGCTGTIAQGESRTCVITNDDPIPSVFTATTGTLIVVKNVVNDNLGTSTASDFTLRVIRGGEVELARFQGSSTGTSVTLTAGTYEVVENEASGYTATSTATCSGAIEAGETITCTFTNEDDGQATTTERAGTLVVIKHVVNDSGRTRVASDFTMTVSGTEVSTSTFAGSEEGVTVTLSPGSYSVDEEFSNTYTKTLGEGCTGTIEAGQRVVCTITNDDIAAPTGPSTPTSVGGGGGGGAVGNGPSGTVQPVGFGPAPVSAPSPAPTTPGRVLGEESPSGNAEVCPITEDEVSVVNGDTEGFIGRGTPRTLRLGSGERRGVIESFRVIYGRSPVSPCDFQNMLRIANGIVPTELNPARERAMEEAFRQLYRRAPNHANAADHRTILIMTYGLRPQARSLVAEYRAALRYRRITGHLPRNTSEWDMVRGMTYGGLTLP